MALIDLRIFENIEQLFSILATLRNLFKTNGNKYSCKAYLFLLCVFIVTPAYSNDKKIKSAGSNKVYSRPCNHDNYLNRKKIIENLKPAEIKILGYAEVGREIIINIYGYFKLRTFAQFLTEIKKQPEFNDVHLLHGRDWCNPRYLTIKVEY